MTKMSAIGTQRTSAGRASMSAFDPKRTSGCRNVCGKKAHRSYRWPSLLRYQRTAFLGLFSLNVSRTRRPVALRCPANREILLANFSHACEISKSRPLSLLLNGKLWPQVFIEAKRLLHRNLERPMESSVQFRQCQIY
jgi:hypothetical protein